VIDLDRDDSEIYCLVLGFGVALVIPTPFMVFLGRRARKETLDIAEAFGKVTTWKKSAQRWDRYRS